METLHPSVELFDEPGIQEDFAKQLEGLTEEQVISWFFKPHLFYALVTGGYKAYGWQRTLLESNARDIAVRVSRQGGKTLTVAVKVAHRLILRPNYRVLIMAPTKEQSTILFRKIQRILEELNKFVPILKRNLRTLIEMNNGSSIQITAQIRGHSPDLLIVDEAAFVLEEVFVAARPSVAATKGDTILISTPFGKQGYFFKAFTILDQFVRIHVSWKQVPHLDADFIEQERRGMTEQEYLQEWEAEFIETADNFFTLEEIQGLIGDTINLGRLPTEEMLERDKYVYYMGVDLARMGLDESVYCVVRQPRNGIGKIEVVHLECTSKMPTTDAIGRIKAMHQAYKFQNIYVDEGSIGGAVIDTLVIDDKVPVVPIMFAQKADTSVTDSKKEAMYKNLQYFAQQNLVLKKTAIARDIEVEPILVIPNDGKLVNQLQALRYQFTSSGRLQIHHPVGGHDDYPDALALALYFTVGRRNYPLAIGVEMVREAAKDKATKTFAEETLGEKLDRLKRGNTPARRPFGR